MMESRETTGASPAAGRGRRWPWLIAACLGVLALVGGAAASIPYDSNGVIHGCYSKTSGSLRIIDSAAACSGTEAAVTWNQTGPKGDTGPQGPAGPTGSQG